MSKVKRKYFFFSLFILICVFAVWLFKNNNHTLLDKGFIEIAESISRVSKEFDISPRILVSVLYAERGLNFTYADEQLDFMLMEAGVNASSGFSQIKYRTAVWIEEQLSNKKSLYWINERASTLIGRSKNKEELIKKLSDTEMNVRFAAAYIAMMIKRWDRDSINISQSPDTLATMYSSGIRSSRKPVYVNIVGRTAKAFYESDRLREYFP